MRTHGSGARIDRTTRRVTDVRLVASRLCWCGSGTGAAEVATAFTAVAVLCW